VHLISLSKGKPENWGLKIPLLNINSGLGIRRRLKTHVISFPILLFFMALQELKKKEIYHCKIVALKGNFPIC